MFQTFERSEVIVCVLYAGARLFRLINIVGEWV